MTNIDTDTATYDTLLLKILAGWYRRWQTSSFSLFQAFVHSCGLSRFEFDKKKKNKLKSEPFSVSNRQPGIPGLPASAGPPGGFVPGRHLRGPDGGQHVQADVEGQERVRQGGGGGGRGARHPRLHPERPRGVQGIQPRVHKVLLALAARFSEDPRVCAGVWWISRQAANLHRAGHHLPQGNHRRGGKKREKATSWSERTHLLINL